MRIEHRKKENLLSNTVDELRRPLIYPMLLRQGRR